MVPGVYKSLLGKILWSHGHRSLNGADGTDLSVDKTTLTFTTTTWETAQTVTVTAVEDELSEGDESAALPGEGQLDSCPSPGSAAGRSVFPVRIPQHA